MAFKLLDRARMAVSGAPGTGNIALGAAVTGYQSFSQAGISNGDSFPYALVDGSNWEYGVATYASSGNQLTRAVTKTSAQNNTPINLSSHTVISGVLRAEDVAGSTTLVGLTDVNMTPSVLTDGYGVVWDNSTGKFILSAAGGGGTLASLTDVVLTTPSNNQALLYNTSATKWKNVSLGAVAISNAFTDLTGKPTNGTYALTGLSDVSITTGAGVDGYSVVWNDGAGKFELSNISGGGGGSSLAVLNNGSSVDAAAVSLNFINATSITTASHAVTITLPTGGGGGGSAETPPVSTNFTAVTHLNSATLTDRSSGAIPSLHVLPGSGDSDGDLYCALQAAPGGTFSIVVGVRHTLIGSNSGWKGAGPVIHNSSGTLSSYVWLTPTYAPAIWVGTFSGGFTGGSPAVGTTINGGDYYLHIDYDGTNVKYGISHNGVDKVWASTVTLASFMGAITHVGIGWSGAFISMEHDFFHWHIGALGTSGL